MSPSFAIDALLLLATSLAAKRRPAEPGEIVAALDLIEPKFPSVEALCAGFTRLGTGGLLIDSDGRLALTEAAEQMIQKLPGKGDHAARLHELKGLISAHKAATPGAPIAIGPDVLTAAIAAHRAAAASGAKNLLVPKPKPEAGQSRPGQRQRKPIGKSRKR